MTLLSHYWREDDPAELTEAIARDWADILESLPQPAIHAACMRYLREHPARKPTPGAIAQMAREEGALKRDGVAAPRGKRDDLSDRDIAILDQKVLPAARRWITQFPDMSHHAKQTLEFWGEEP